MKRLLIGVFLVIVIFLLSRNVAIATELIYMPVNPSFGGHPANGQWLLNSAEAQNKFKESSDERRRLERNPLQDFENQLSRRILSNLASRIVNMAFGEDDLEGGHYVIGDLTIDITTGTDEIRVVITDRGTGNTTTIEIPYY